MRIIPVLTLLAAGLLAACGNDAPPAPEAAPPTVQQEVVQQEVIEQDLSADPLTDQGEVEEIEEVSAAQATWQTLAAKYPVLTILSVDEVPGTNLFEVRTEEWGHGMMGYTNQAVDYVYVDGKLYLGVGEGLVDYTSKSLNDRMYRLITGLPFDQGLTFSYGNAERTLVVFEDPDCPECQALEADFQAAGDSLNALVRVMPLPLTDLHPQAEARWRYILCTPDPESAWMEWMTDEAMRADWTAFSQKHPSTGECPRANAVDVSMEVTTQLGMKQTPTLMFANGMIYNGRPSMEELERAFLLVESAMDNGVGVSPPREIPSNTAPDAEPSPAPQTPVVPAESLLPSAQ